MKLFQITSLAIGGLILGGGIVASLSNPSLDQYESYAGGEIAIYLKNNVCQNMAEDLPFNIGSLPSELLDNYCKTLVDASEAQLGEIIGSETTANNFFFFSIYQTDIDLPEPFPRYSFNTIGIFHKFYTYRAEKS